MLYPKKDFSKFTVLQVQNLLAHQKESFDLFQKTALRQVFKEYFPVSDYSDKDLRLEFVDCYFGKPKNTEEEARRVNASYEAPLRVKFRLVNLISKETEDQEIYFGDFPIMTDRGSFIINGNERVIINQLVRSAGVYFTAVQFGERKLFGAKLIPQKGSWLEFQVEPTNMVQVRVNRRKKVPVTVMLKALGVTQKELETMFEGVDNPEVNFIKTTSKRDETKDQEDALLEIHHKLRPFEPNTFDNAQAFFESMFLMEDRYSLSEVGRYKFNQRLNISGVTEQVLRKEDVIAIITELLRLMNDPLADADDMDSLEYRRIRDVSELLGNQARIGVARLVKNIKDRMSTVDKTQKLFPSNVLYPRIFTNSLKEFFNLSPLSQLLDQVNIMSEVEHKRRLTVGGPGGLNKDRAGFEVRDLHPSHYGKICPIQTPEGSSIGLVLYRALYSRKNDFGFLETPYYKVEKGRVTDVLEYIDTKKEKLSIIASANVMLDKKKMIMGDEIEARINNEPSLVSKDQVDYMEVSPFQIFSASTSSIPFVEHNDANRAQMGSNMQKQAVPLIRPHVPQVGTGLEEAIAKSSGYVVVAEHDGEVVEADGSHIMVLYDSKEGKAKKTYYLQKFQKTNSFTCFHQRPIVAPGQKFKKGDALADGPSTNQGALALGQNLTVAFLFWYGFNFEDAVIVSSRVLKQDAFTSIFLEEFSVDVRDTKLGKEETTGDIPNIPESKLRNLDSEGVIRIGAEVRPGDILVGKITPKKELDLTPEEKLLKAIFGEKVEEIKDSSLYVEPGKSGRVIRVKSLTRSNGEISEPGVIKRISLQIAKLRKLQIGDKLANRHGNKGIVAIIVPEEDMPFLPDGTPVDIILSPLGVVSRMNLGQILELHMGYAASKQGYRAVVPPMSGMGEEELKEELKKAGIAPDGKTVLYDGKSGEPFGDRVAVGTMHMMKLSHMVEDKIHARSIGPYSLITQQPLGGKSQFGGQRLGEMEVWALEAYGAGNILQEMLTLKSDDVKGRSNAYASIIKGEEIRMPSMPSAFNVLVKELQGLGLNIDIKRNDREGMSYDTVGSIPQSADPTESKVPERPAADTK